MGTLADLLRQLPAPLVLVVGVLVVAESGLVIGVVLPGASPLLTLGFLASIRVVPLPAAMVTASCAAPAGTTFAFLRGRRTGETSRVARLVSGRALPSGTSTGPALFLAQWLVGARTLAPRLAGARGLAYPRFAAWNMPSAGPWGATLVGTGWAAGASYRRIATLLGWSGAAVAGLLVIIVAILVARSVRGRSGEGRDMVGDPLGEGAGRAAENTLDIGADPPQRG